MKVLLFVQYGDARPKCAGRCYHGGEQWRVNDTDLGGSMHGSVKVHDALYSADRWWLVECENAEAGRRVIAEAVEPNTGRVLGGGRR